MNPKTVFRLWDEEEECWASSYERGNYDKYEWASGEDARRANVHGVFEDEKRYTVKEFVVTYAEVVYD